MARVSRLGSGMDAAQLRLDAPVPIEAVADMVARAYKRSLEKRGIHTGITDYETQTDPGEERARMFCCDRYDRPCPLLVLASEGGSDERVYSLTGCNAPDYLAGDELRLFMQLTDTDPAALFSEFVGKEALPRSSV